MALITELEKRGINLENAYIKVQNIVATLNIYPDIEARKEGKLFDTESLQIPISPAIYEAIKAKYPNAVNETTNDWQTA